MTVSRSKPARMTLLDHLSHSGDFLFRWRSYFPLLLLPVFLLALADSPLAAAPGGWARVWQLLCLLLSLAGLAIRVLTIGTAPPGTSERSTTDPRASALSTTGAYSIVRHPLYVGNTLVALGLACFPAVWYLPTIVLLASLVYHERIAAREERFLEERFGDDFRRWADHVPAAVPVLSRYVPPADPFRWRRVLGREFHALFVIGAGFFLLDVARRLILTGLVSADPLWTGVLALTGAIFVVLLTIKKSTRWLGAG
jgi:protein-S-isoprenylcysteine O-methyltransferase Ste14